MMIYPSLKSGTKSLLHNKLRSTLTMLGIVIGIFSVIMLTSIGEGLKQRVKMQVESLGANLLYIIPGKINFMNKGENKLGTQTNLGQIPRNTLSYDDVLKIKNEKNVKGVTGYFNGIDRLDDLGILVTTTGVDSDLGRILKIHLKYGRFFNEKEVSNIDKVAVIGYQANKELYANKNSIGKKFKLNGREFRVVGVLKYVKPEAMGPNPEDFNTKIYIPITEMMNRSTDKKLGQIIVKASSSNMVIGLEKRIKNLLIKSHYSDDFTVIKQQDMLEVINNILGILTAGLGGIAAISLLVGGIGIMNIMLVSVTERTKEIGVRKALGATKYDVMLQFLIEAIFISVIGGILGVALGVLGSKMISKAFPQVFTAVSIPAVVIAIFFAVVVGIFFGVYPAMKAASLNPIEALRNE